MFDRPGRCAKPKYRRYDTTAALARLSEIRRREAIPVPAELITPIDEFLARQPKREKIHVPVTVGDPEHWRSALGGWEQIGTVDPSGLEKLRGRVPNYEAKERPHRTFERKNFGDDVAPVVRPEAADARFTAASPTAIAVLGVSGCRFPIGEPGAAGFRFCGAARLGRSYCADHMTIAVYVPSARRA